MLYLPDSFISTTWAYAIFRFFRRMGPLGLFLLGALDSSFLFLPFGNDLLLIALVSADHGSVQTILFVLMSALGSVAGVLIIDLLMRKAGDEGLKRFLKPKQIARLRKKMEKRAGWAVLLTTLLPPPFPFTPVIMAASALQYSRQKLLGAVFVGRLIRYSFEAVLAIYFGRKLLKYVNSPVVEYFVYAFIAIAIIGSTLSILKWVRSRKDEAAATA